MSDDKTPAHRQVHAQPKDAKTYFTGEDAEKVDPQRDPHLAQKAKAADDTAKKKPGKQN
jgi:hypothetical protein